MSTTSIGFQKIVGNLFVAYSGNPLVRAKCNQPSCQDQAEVRVNAVYKFSVWFLKKIIICSVSSSMTTPFDLAIRIRNNVRASDSEWFCAVLRGYNKTVQMFLRYHQAHINDVDEYGNDALCVSTEVLFR